MGNQYLESIDKILDKSERSGSEYPPLAAVQILETFGCNLSITVNPAQVTAAITNLEAGCC